MGPETNPTSLYISSLHLHCSQKDVLPPRPQYADRRVLVVLRPLLHPPHRCDRNKVCHPGLGAESGVDNPNLKAMKTVFRITRFVILTINFPTVGRSLISYF
ncbi:unnamed protein product [Oncorhynchus mykiss]|uniref:Uncharacterized protein n=1 Tax=Oncorhynchus mykiss TaxID=8022 RepID=A0A060Z5W6_ONCMY|nr:unnamed protein product [Oncorhynchus mykiss]